MAESARSVRSDRLVEQIAEAAARLGATIAVAESLTGGQLAAALAAGRDSGSWFRGAVVAYHPEVKFGLLGVPRGPVVNERTAASMALAARDRLGADYAVSATGVGGPGAEEGKPEGTVVIGVATPDGSVRCSEYCFPGSPIEVLHRTIECGLEQLRIEMRAGATKCE